VKPIKILFLLIIITGVCSFSSCRSSKSAEKKHKTSRKEENAEVAKVIKTAKSYIGTPYKYGGTSRSGMDCSGLLLNSFQAIDRKIPRTAEEQSKIGIPADIGNLKKGDLVFFSEKKGSKKIVHVGIVTQVNGTKDIKFIHSSTKLGVVESDLYAPYYINILVKARRVF
jgi:probable lipoprotein NlpC